MALLDRGFTTGFPDGPPGDIRATVVRPDDLQFRPQTPGGNGGGSTGSGSTGGATKTLKIGTFGNRAISDGFSRYTIETTGKIIQGPPQGNAGKVYAPGGSDTIKYTGEITRLELGPQLATRGDDTVNPSAKRPTQNPPEGNEVSTTTGPTGATPGPSGSGPSTQKEPTGSGPAGASTGQQDAQPTPKVVGFLSSLSPPQIIGIAAVLFVLLRSN